MSDFNVNTFDSVSAGALGGQAGSLLDSATLGGLVTEEAIEEGVLTYGGNSSHLDTSIAAVSGAIESGQHLGQYMGETLGSSIVYNGHEVGGAINDCPTDFTTPTDQLNTPAWSSDLASNSLTDALSSAFDASSSFTSDISQPSYDTSLPGDNSSRLSLPINEKWQGINAKESDITVNSNTFNFG